MCESHDGTGSRILPDYTVTTHTDIGWISAFKKKILRNSVGHKATKQAMSILQICHQVCKGKEERNYHGEVVIMVMIMITLQGPGEALTATT